MTTGERLAAVIANALVSFGLGHYLLGAPWWASILWFSLENGVVSLRPSKAVKP